MVQCVLVLLVSIWHEYTIHLLTIKALGSTGTSSTCTYGNWMEIRLFGTIAYSDIQENRQRKFLAHGSSSGRLNAANVQIRNEMHCQHQSDDTDCRNLTSFGQTTCVTLLHVSPQYYYSVHSLWAYMRVSQCVSVVSEKWQCTNVQVHFVIKAVK